MRNRSKCRRSGNEPGAGVRVGDKIFELDCSGADVAERGGDPDSIIVFCGRVVTERRISHCEADTFVLDFCVWSSKRSHKLRPADLAPDEIVGMIDNLHLVCLCVSHTQLYRMLCD